jgi:putative FmdB family regulatory protein
MRKLYEYTCRKCSNRFTDLVEERDRTLGATCPTCGGLGDYVLSTPYVKGDINSDQWLKKRQSHMKKEQKNLRNHGTYD